MSFKKFIGLGMTALRSNFSQLKQPYKLTFAISYLCNSRCKTCNIWQLKPKGELSIDEIREFARKNRSFRWIEITGGEPFLRSDIVEIVRAFYENSKGLYIVTIPTNSLTNHDMVISKIEQMLDLGLPRLSITVSLDGYRELHDEIRGVKGNYDKAIEMFRRLKALKEKRKNLFVVFGYTMSSMNQGMLEKTYEEVKKDIPEVTYNDFHINAAQLSEIYYNNTDASILPNAAAMADEVEAYIKKRRFEFGSIPAIEGTFLRLLVKYLRTGKSPIKSRSLDASLFLDSYGNVYPSIMWSRKIGNIRDFGYSLEGMWHNDEANMVRKIIKEGKEPQSWTACEAYQAIVGDIKTMIK
ncbi:MAG: radical SAM protein [Candidatus Micrarchaeaceae archaeon]